MATDKIQDAYIVAAVRTPVGKAPRGMFKTVRPDDMLAHVLKAAVDQCPGLDPAAIDDVIAGCAMPEAEQGMNVARIALLLAGLPDSVPGMTINRFCASGLQAVALAADRIRLGHADVIIGAGTESMSMVPMTGNKMSFDPAIFQHDENVAIAYGMGITGEKVAQRWQVSREAQDEFAVTSHAKALKATATGEFKQEIAPYTVEEKRPDLASHEIREVSVVRETRRRAAPRYRPPKSLSKLKPVFAANGSVTAGNSSQMSDGAGAVIVASEAALKRFNLTPIARFLGLLRSGCAAGNHGHWPDQGDTESAEAGWTETGGSRLDRIERSLCGAEPGSHQRSGAGS